MRKAIVCIAVSQKRSIRSSIGGKQLLRTSSTGIKSCKEREVLTGFKLTTWCRSKYGHGLIREKLLFVAFRISRGHEIDSLEARSTPKPIVGT